MELQLLEVARLTAVQVGQWVGEQWLQPRQLSQKGFRDFVTDADIASQKLITDAIQHQFPTHGFLTEEDDSTLPTDGDWVWIIDPIDGTSNYSRQMVNFAVSLAVAQPTSNGLQVRVGAIYDPLQEELFSAVQGLGAWQGPPSAPEHRSLAVSTTADLSQAIFCLDWSHSPAKREKTLVILHRLAHAVRTIRAVGSAALAMSWLAAGRVEAYLNLNLKPWDAAAAQLLIREAGGHISHLDGRDWQFGQLEVISSNGHLHQQIQALIQST